MALRMICTNCNGSGIIKKFPARKVGCVQCQGSGLFIEKNFYKIIPKKKLNKKRLS